MVGGHRLVALLGLGSQGDGGARHLVGFNGLVNGGLDAEQTKIDALRRLADRGFANGEPKNKVGKPADAAAKKGSN